MENLSIIRLDQVKQILTEIKTVDEAKSIIDKAEALRVYARQAKLGLEAQNHAAEIKIRAERRAGELLREVERSNGARTDITSFAPQTRFQEALKDAGVKSTQTAHKWQSIAGMPEPDFEAHVAQVKASGKELTSAGLLKTARVVERDDARERLAEQGRAGHLPDDIHLYHGDMEILYDMLPDSSVDLFFTDPPYTEADTLQSFEALGQLAAAKLRPGGLCLAYSGHMHLLRAANALQNSLSYWWIFALRSTGGHQTIWNRQVWTDWKPILVFARPHEDGSLPLAPEWVQDFRDGGGKDKRYHEWGQDASEATYWLEKLSTPHALVCDPYVGGGAIPVACKLTGRRFVGTEIDETNANIARARLVLG